MSTCRQDYGRLCQLVDMTMFGINKGNGVVFPEKKSSKHVWWISNPSIGE